MKLDEIRVTRIIVKTYADKLCEVAEVDVQESGGEHLEPTWRSSRASSAPAAACPAAG